METARNLWSYLKKQMGVQKFNEKRTQLETIHKLKGKIFVELGELISTVLSAYCVHISMRERYFEYGC